MAHKLETIAGLRQGSRAGCGTAHRVDSPTLLDTPGSAFARLHKAAQVEEEEEEEKEDGEEKEKKDMAGETVQA